MQEFKPVLSYEKLPESFLKNKPSDFIPGNARSESTQSNPYSRSLQYSEVGYSIKSTHAIAKPGIFYFGIFLFFVAIIQIVSNSVSIQQYNKESDKNKNTADNYSILVSLGFGVILLFLSFYTIYYSTKAY